MGMSYKNFVCASRDSIIILQCNAPAVESIIKICPPAYKSKRNNMDKRYKINSDIRMCVFETQCNNIMYNY